MHLQRHTHAGQTREFNTTAAHRGTQAQIERARLEQELAVTSGMHPGAVQLEHLRVRPTLLQFEARLHVLEGRGAARIEIALLSDAAFAQLRATFEQGRTEVDAGQNTALHGQKLK